jgi:ABC-type multidrug transport system fused ATPase/permease subunit
MTPKTPIKPKVETIELALSKPITKSVSVMKSILVIYQVNTGNSSVIFNWCNISTVKALGFKQTDYYQILKLVSEADRIRLLTVSFIQILLSFLDLIGVAFFGLIGSVSVAAISSTKIVGRTESVINFLGINNYSSQVQVAILGGLAAILMIVKTIASLYFNKKVIFFLSRRSALMSANLTSNLFKKSFSEIKMQGSQNLIYTLTTGVDCITVGVLATSVALIADFSLLIVLLAGLIFVNPIMTVILLFCLGLVATLLYLFIRNKKKRLGILQARYSISSSNKIFEATGNYRELLLRGQRQVFADGIGKARLSQADTTANTNYLTNINKYILEASVLLITLLISGVQFLLSNALRSVATLTLFFAAISRIAPAIFRIQQNLLTIKSALGGAKPTLELINSLQLSINRLDSNKPTEQVPAIHDGFVGKIKISNLRFQYAGSQINAVENVNLELNSGSYVAVVGPSGAGKSTFVDLLLGLHHPTSGSVEISGVDALEAIEKWPGAISYVPQQIQLVSGTISENVLLGFKDDEHNNKEVLIVLQKAQLNEYIDSDGLIKSTNIGDEGGKLSGGQRQRIGIARALLTNPKILVMDEATSALDAQTEENISNTISKIKDNCLVIVVAHRLATVRKADLVLYMQDGQVKAKGSFDEVRAQVPDFDKQAQLMGL